MEKEVEDVATKVEEVEEAEEADDAMVEVDLAEDIVTMWILLNTRDCVVP